MSGGWFRVFMSGVAVAVWWGVGYVVCGLCEVVIGGGWRYLLRRLCRKLQL